MAISLRQLQLTDIQQLVKLADNKALADDMCTLPENFSEEDAMDLIRRSIGEEEVLMGIIDLYTEQLCGVVMLRDFEPCHEQAEMSIWIGEAFWGKGYGTEAITKMADIGFREKQLNRIYAYCMVRNNASQRILEKSGFNQEGLLRQRVIKNGVYEDVFIYAKIKRDQS